MHTIKSIKITAFAMAIALVGTTPAAIAATATTTMAVEATVLSTCIVVATPVLFGEYSLSARDASGLITVTCTPDVLAYDVGLDAGTGSGATTTVRKMTALLVGASTLSYSLFRDSSRTQNWGDTVGELQPSSAAATTIGTIKTFPVYGRLTANQTATIGAYLDTIQVAVNY